MTRPNPYWNQTFETSLFVNDFPWPIIFSFPLFSVNLELYQAKDVMSSPAEVN